MHRQQPETFSSMLFNLLIFNNHFTPSTFFDNHNQVPSHSVSSNQLCHSPLSFNKAFHLQNNWMFFCTILYKCYSWSCVKGTTIFGKIMDMVSCSHTLITTTYLKCSFNRTEGKPLTPD